MKQLKAVLIMVLAVGVLCLPVSVDSASKKDGKPDGGKLVYGEYGRPSTLDPITGNDMVSLRMAELLFDGLVDLDKRGEVVSSIAKKWNVSADNYEYIFDLRQDIIWHAPAGMTEEKKLSAADVVYTYKCIMNNKTITPLKDQYEFVESVKSTGPYQVKFRLKRPVINAVSRMSFKVVPKHGPRSNYLSRKDPFCRNPLGSGPYRFEEMSAEGEITLKANENYQRGRPHIDSVAMKPFADQNVMTQSLLYSAIDLIPRLNPRDIPEIEGDRRFVLKPYNALSYSFFGYNLKNSLLAEKKVRQAIGHAINRQEMLDSFYMGRGRIITGPYAPGSWAYNLDVKPVAYSVSKAEKLLAQAGFTTKNKQGIRTRDGVPLEFSLKVPIEKENESVKRVVLAFQNYLKAVGIKVNVEFREWRAWKEDVFDKHDFDIVIAAWVFDDSADISSLFHSSEIGSWRNNFISYSNPEVDSLIVESKNTLDREKRRVINQRLHKLLAEECPYTFLWSLNNYAAVHKKVRKVEIHPFKFFSYVDEWYIPKKEQK